MDPIEAIVAKYGITTRDAWKILEELDRIIEENNRQIAELNRQIEEKDRQIKIYEEYLLKHGIPLPK